MDFNKLVARAKAILLSPTTEWPVIADEPATVSEIFKNYVIWLAAISAVAGFIGNTVVGYSVPFLGHYRMGFGAGLTGAIVTYVLSLAGVFLVAYLADALAPTFGGQKNFTQAVKAVAYAYIESGWRPDAVSPTGCVGRSTTRRYATSWRAGARGGLRHADVRAAAWPAAAHHHRDDAATDEIDPPAGGARGQGQHQLHPASPEPGL